MLLTAAMLSLLRARAPGEGLAAGEDDDDGPTDEAGRALLVVAAPPPVLLLLTSSPCAAPPFLSVKRKERRTRAAGGRGTEGEGEVGRRWISKAGQRSESAEETPVCLGLVAQLGGASYRQLSSALIRGAPTGQPAAGAASHARAPASSNLRNCGSAVLRNSVAARRCICLYARIGETTRKERRGDSSGP